MSEVSRDGPTVLLVDDEPLFLDVFAFHVERRGGEVVRAPSAEAALHVLESRSVDLVVTDWDMPAIDGALLRRKIRRRVKVSAVPIAVLTGVPIGPEMPRPCFAKTDDLGEVVERLFELVDGCGPRGSEDDDERSDRNASGRRRHVGLRARSRGGWRRLARRGVDCAVAGGGLVLSAPLFAVVGLLGALDRSEPILSRQSRVGLGGRTFDLLRFRCTRRGPDGRRTRTGLGRVLRRFSLDALPQLWNVLVGDLTLVGPRAPEPSEVGAGSLHGVRLLDVKPGLLGERGASERAATPPADAARVGAATARGIAAGGGAGRSALESRPTCAAYEEGN